MTSSLLAILAFAVFAWANGKPDLEVRKVGEEYRITGSYTIPANRDAVWDALTDYDRLHKFVEPIKRSRTLKTEDDGSHLVEQVSIVKVLLMRRESRVVLLKKEFPKKKIVSSLVDGDFITYHAEWRLENVEGRCLLLLEMNVRPKMKVPGWIERRALKGSVEKTYTGVHEEAVRRMRDWSSDG